MLWKRKCRQTDDQLDGRPLGGDKKCFDIGVYDYASAAEATTNLMRTRLHKSRSSRDELEFDLSNFV